MLDIILEFWPVLTFLGAGLIWLIRLENSAMANAKEVRRLWNVREEDNDRFEKEHEKTNRKLDRIEGYLVKGIGDLNADIKHLLERK